VDAFQFDASMKTAVQKGGAAEEVDEGVYSAAPLR
jgi:hypothetical protein